MMRGRDVRRSRGFTLLETVMVLVLVSLVSAASIAWYGRATAPDQDVAAKTSLLSFTELQQQAFMSTGAPSTAAQLGAADYTRSWVAGGPSTGPQVVAVSTAGMLALAAVDAGEACWYVRMDLQPTPVSPPVLWYVDTSTVSCDASSVTSFPVPDTSDSEVGTVPGKPVVL